MDSPAERVSLQSETIKRTSTQGRSSITRRSSCGGKIDFKPTAINDDEQQLILGSAIGAITLGARSSRSNSMSVDYTALVESAIDEDGANQENCSKLFPMCINKTGKAEDLQLPMKWILLWSMPSAVVLSLFVIKILVMKRFYTDEHDANLGYMSIFITVGVLFDAFSDPSMANYTDNCRSRFGRRRPFLVIGAVLGIPIFTLSFWPLVGDGIPATIWYGLFNIGAKVVDTVYMIPHDAWGAELTPVYKEKSRVFLMRSLCATLGLMIGCIMPMFGSTIGMAKVCFLLGVILLLATLVFVALAKERPISLLPAVDKRKWSEDGIVPSFVSVLVNRPFANMVLSLAIEFIGSMLPFEVLPFYFRGVFGEVCMDQNSQVAIAAAVQLVVRTLSVFFWLWLAGRIGKYKVLIYTLCLYAPFSVFHIFFTRDTEECAQFKMFLLLMALYGSLGGMNFLLHSILSDIVDYDEVLTGKRREGFYMMAMEFLTKFSQIPSSAVFFCLLANFGYERPGDWSCYIYDTTLGQDEAWCKGNHLKTTYHENLNAFRKFSINEDSTGTTVKDLCGTCSSNCCWRQDPVQPDAVVWLLKSSFGFFPALFTLLCFILLLRYPKKARTEDDHKRVIAAIDETRAGRAVDDPYFPGHTLHPVAEGTTHANYLSHFWPREIHAAMAGGSSGVPNYKALATSCQVQLAIGVLSALVGVVLFVVGWDSLQDELGGSVAPIGAMFLGVALLIGWFNTVRLRAAWEIARLQVEMEEFRVHWNYLCRFTGGAEIDKSADVADACPPEPQRMDPQAYGNSRE